MRNKILLLVVTMSCVSVHSFSQTDREKIERQARDPKTAENAAKADDIIIDKKIVADSTLPPHKNIQSRNNCHPARKKKV